METSILDRASEFLRQHKDDRRSQALLLFLALLVALATVALLTKPGQAMTHKKRVLDCPLSVHQHTKSCYDKTGELICGYADYVVHTHNDDCYDEKGNLVCQIPERKEHTHTSDCFREEQVLVCDQQESEGHEHSEKCYEKVRGALTCDKEETKGHKHDESCYDEDVKLTCDKEEEKPHEHTDECYEWSEELTCGKEESEGHTHTDACYETKTVCVCGESELHTHDKDCYDKDGKLICGKPELLEHIHGAECFREVEMTDEEVAALNGTPDEEEKRTAGECSVPEDASAACETTPNVPAGETTSTDVPAAVEATPTNVIAGDESAQTEEAESAETITKVYRDQEIEVTAEYTAEAKLPKNAELRVRLATQEDIAEARKGEDAAEEEDDEDSLFYVIGFYVGDREIEPEAPVSVKMRFLDGKFKDEENLSVEHYTKEGKEEFLPEVQKDEEGNAEAAFTTSSFSVYKVSAARSTSGQTVTKATEIPNCGVEDCMGKCNIYWEVSPDKSAKVIKYLPRDGVSSYHIHDYVRYQGVDYQVKDVSKITNYDAVHSWHNTRVGGKEVIIDDNLAQKMIGNQSITFSAAQSVPTQDSPEVKGYLPGERNNTSDALMWKSAGYNEKDNSVEISLKYFQKRGNLKPVDLVFILDDSCTMWNCCSTCSIGGYSARSGLYQRAMAQAICQALLSDGTNDNGVRIAFVNHSGNKAVQDSGTFFSTYAEAKDWLQKHYLNREVCKNYAPASKAAINLIKNKSESGRTPAVVWFSDFHYRLETSEEKEYAPKLRQAATGGVYTVTFREKDADKNYAGDIATIDERYAFPVEVGCCHITKEYDPTHMFLASNMADVFANMGSVIQELMGYYISPDTVLWDELSPGVNALKLENHTGDGYAGRYASSGGGDPYAAHDRDLSWLFLQKDQNDEEVFHRMLTGQLYEHRFSFQLDDNTVYSGHMSTNGTASVEQGGTTVNEVTNSPRLQKPVELELQSNANKTPMPNGGAFELRDSADQVVWTGQADKNGMLTIPYGNGNGEVLFEKGTQYTLKQTSVINGYHLPEGSWKLTVSENYTIGSETIRPNGNNDSHTHDMNVQNGHFVVLNDVKPYATDSVFTYNVYWVAKNPDGTVTALSEKEARWWQYQYQDWVHTVEIKPGQGAAHINGVHDSSFWTPSTLPTQKDEHYDPPFQLCGYGIGKDFGTASNDEELKRIQNVSLEWECPANQDELNEGWGLGIEWISDTELIHYFKIALYHHNHLDEQLMGEMTAEKAVYIIYQDIRPVKLTVRKVWLDRDEGKSHENDTVAFTITPQGGEALTNEDGTLKTFTLTKANAVEGQPNVWQTTLDVPRSGSYTVTETSVKPGYGVTYHTDTLPDGTPSVITITNIEGAELPGTGGTGTYPYTIGGTAILAGGLLYGLQLRRRREGAAE